MADAPTESESGGSTFVEFDAEAGEGDGLTYFAEAPAESGAYQFGPVEVSADGGETWHAVPGTVRSNFVAGTGLTLGSTAGAVGVLGHQRDRVRERLGSLLGSEE
jgi:hypothetical protein